MRTATLAGGFARGTREARSWSGSRLGLPFTPDFATPGSTATSSRQISKGRTAGEGNRTLVSSLEGYSSTIELHPRAPSKLTRVATAAKFFSDSPGAVLRLAFSRHAL